MTAQGTADLVEILAGDKLDTEQQIQIGRCVLFIWKEVGWLTNDERLALCTLFVLNASLFDPVAELARVENAPR